MQGEDKWAIATNQLSLERDFLVGTGAVYFGQINDVEVGSGGRIFVGDPLVPHVVVLSANGTVHDTIGQQGRGPGEFDNLTDMTLARGDSLYVLDRAQQRVSVFSPSGHFGYTASIDAPYADEIMVPEERGGLILESRSLPRSPSSTRQQFTVQWLGSNGAVRDPLVTTRGSRVHREKQGDTLLFRSIPFEPSPEAAMGPEDRVHLARAGSLSVVSYDFDGVPRPEADVPFDPVPVTEEDVKRMFGRDSPIPRDKIPTTKPAFNQFLVDDEGRYWFVRPTADPDSSAWWVVQPKKRRVVTATLPRTDVAYLMAVRDGYMYGLVGTEPGAVALGRYRIRLPE